MVYSKNVFWSLNETERFLPGFVLSGQELYYQNSELGIPDDSVSLKLVQEHPGIVLIEAVDGRGTTDGSPAYRKFLCYSFFDERQLITTYLAYLYTGPIKVQAWKPELKSMFKDIDMYHIDITPQRTPERVIQEHLIRLEGKVPVFNGLIQKTEEAFFDMLWNIPSFP